MNLFAKDLRVPFCLLMVLATVVLGLAVRSGLLPAPVSKYGGSALYAVMLYWLIAAILARRPNVAIAVIALLAVYGVEFFKLVRTPALDAFRLTLPGKLMLGRVFSNWDLLAYLAGIILVVVADKPLQRWTEDQIRNS